MVINFHLPSGEAETLDFASYGMLARSGMLWELFPDAPEVWPKAKAPAVLFCRADSIYKTLSCDVWDEARDARRWPGGCSAIAHPPCRGWGRLRKQSKATEEEKALGLYAVEMVRRWGGILEHPAHSSLWTAAGLPLPGQRDAIGGFTFPVPQFWWGHRAEKQTWFYVVGCEPKDLPETPFQMGIPPRVITNKKGLRSWMLGYRKEVTRPEREHTPAALAAWLIEAALKINVLKGH